MKKFIVVLLLCALVSPIYTFNISAEKNEKLHSAESIMTIFKKENVEYFPKDNGESFDFLGLSVYKVIQGETNSEYHIYKIFLSDTDAKTARDHLYRTVSDKTISVTLYDTKVKEYVFVEPTVSVIFANETDLPLDGRFELMGINVKKANGSGLSYTLEFDSHEEANEAYYSLIAKDEIISISRGQAIRSIYNVGDINFDGEISVIDYAYIKRYVLSGYMLSYKRNSDINADGTVDAKDYGLLKAHILGTNKLDHLNIKRETN